MSFSNLEDLFMLELKDTPDAERKTLKALPKMAKTAETKQLKAAFAEQKSAAETHVERSETIFKQLDKAARGKHGAGMEGLLEEGEDMIKKEDPGAPLDAAMIAPRKKLERYEIGAYGTPCRGRCRFSMAVSCGERRLIGEQRLLQP